VSEPQNRIAIVRDEAAPGFAEAIEICLPLGIRAYEVRSLDGRRVPNVAEDALEEVVRETSDRGLTLVGISPGLCKIPLDQVPAGDAFVSSFDQSFGLMARLGVRQITIFSYLRTDPEAPIPQQVIDRLGVASELCAGVRTSVW